MSAFYEHPNWKRLVVTRNVTVMGEFALGGCSKLENVIFDEGSMLREIRGEAFLWCRKIKKCDFLRLWRHLESMLSVVAKD